MNMKYYTQKRFFKTEGNIKILVKNEQTLYTRN